MRFLLLIAALLFPSWAFATPAFDAADVATVEGFDTISFSLTTSGSNRYIIGCGRYNDSAALVTDFTFNSVSGTEISTVTNGSGDPELSMWQLIAPASGSHTAEMTLNSSPGFFEFGVMSFTGVNQATPRGSPSSQESGDTQSTVTISSSATDLVAECFGSTYSQTPYTEKTDQTVRFSNFFNGFAGSTKAGATSVDVGYTWGPSSDYFVEIAVSLKAVASTVVRRRPIIIQ